MKRATLTAYPTTSPSEPADLTDRLLERRASLASAPPVRRRRVQPPARAGEPGANLAPPPATTPTTAPASALETAIAAAEAATGALREAAREAPARYDVALHYRLDALALHLQQVKEFVAALTAR